VTLDRFPLDVHTNLNWYVYRLIDPRNGYTFYVGKGKGDRVFEHARGALQEEIDSTEGVMALKNDLIREIDRAGLEVLHVIHRHGLESSELAYEVEAALIDAYPGLTNEIGGHRSGVYGCRSAQQIIAAYAADPLVAKEPLILIFVGKTLDAGRDLYDAVRGVWKMSRAKAETHNLVLAYDGVTVSGAYRPTKWLPGTKENFPFLNEENPKRIGFEGARAEVWADYVGKRVPPRPRGAANPVRYLPPGSAEESE
jgi:hypothetical protein